jgi:GNAT superfamily N-acetyltransferase
MPAIMDDPDSATIYRVSGAPPYPDPNDPTLPPDIHPRHVTLRDRQTVATVVPFASKDQVPASLLLYLSDQFKKEIEGGDTYPMMDPMPSDKFASYWFQNFGAIMLLGSIESADEVVEGKNWSKECLGSFYIKPNYPGRSSHVCNAGFLVTDASRGRGVGRLMGESYLDYAPKLGYTYSVFNLVYETNVASCKIWDALGFKRIGRVKGCGNLKSYPGRLIDAIIYGRDLGPGAGDNEELVSEERFDKIKFYLKYGKYPAGADRAEKSRLRSAATHYKLLENDKLMLKDKEVISDPGKQYEIARAVHVTQHGGINKTTATIAEKYHWSRIKETVTDVIKNCTECKELAKTPVPGYTTVQRRGNNNVSSNSAAAAAAAAAASSAVTPSAAVAGASGTAATSSSSSAAASRSTASSVPNSGANDNAAGRVLTLQSHHHLASLQPPPTGSPYDNPSDISAIAPSQTLQSHPSHRISRHPGLPHHNPMLQDQPDMQRQHHHHSHTHPVYQPIDPQIINQPSSPHHHHHHHDHHHHHHHHNPFDPYAPHHHSDPSADTDFQALLNATGEPDVVHTVPQDGSDHDVDAAAAAEQAAVDRDLDMLIEQVDEDDVDQPMGGVDGASEMKIVTVGTSGVLGRNSSESESKGAYDVSFGGPG